MKQVRRRRRKAPKVPSRFDDILAEARSLGCFDDTRAVEVLSHVPASLLRAARRKAGVRSNSKLLILALSLLAVQDDFGDQLLRLKGSVDPRTKLEF